nr:PQQ-binding-like beta-propeller repeat protein [Micromonospora tarapacensis]
MIDLGELTEPADPAPTRRRRTGGRRLGAAVVALVALLTLAGAAPPARRIHATVAAALGTDLFLTDDQIFAVSPMPQVTDGSQELLAYPRPVRATVRPQRLAPLWRVPVQPANRIYRVQSVDDGGVLVSMGRESTRTSETVRLDARTGQERWRQPGIAIFDMPDRALLRTFNDGVSNSLRMIELATARELWSMPLSAASVDYRQHDGVVDAVVVATVDGEVEVVDPETGTIRHRLPAPDDDPAGYQQAAVVGDLVLVIRNSNTIAAHTVDGLIRRWQVSVPTATYVTPCGRLLCAGMAGGGLTVLDPGTGAVRWSSGDVLDLMLVGERNTVALVRGTNEVVTLDVETGAIVTEHGTWEPIIRYEYAPQLLGVRPLSDEGLVLARLDPSGRPARRIDVLPRAGGSCQGRYDLVACRLFDGGYGIWQLPG